MFFGGLDSQLGQTGQLSKKQSSKVLINETFLIKKIVERKDAYNMYEGIDILNHKFVSIYIKPVSGDNSFSRAIKQDIRSKIMPPVIWQGSQKIEKVTYAIEVHEKYGPSLRQMFAQIKNPISESDFIHLFYQMIKLVERISSSSLVYRQLSMNTIVFDTNPQKNELYVLNAFPIRKKNEEGMKINSKHCSKGSHLGINANVKDDLESICYLLLDIYSKGKFLKNLNASEYESAKNSLDPKSVCSNLPQIFIEFYYYVTGMNYTDEINYFHWKNQILKHISKELITKPFGWMRSEVHKESRIDPIDNSSLSDVDGEVDEEKENLTSKLEGYQIKCNGNSLKESRAQN